MMTPDKKKAQIQRTFEELKKEPATTMMLAKKTGILRANLTRYIAALEKRNKVTVVTQAPCEITGHVAKYYSSNSKYFRPKVQSEMFTQKHQGAFSR